MQRIKSIVSNTVIFLVVLSTIVALFLIFSIFESPQYGLWLLLFSVCFLIPAFILILISLFLRKEKGIELTKNYTYLIEKGDVIVIDLAKANFSTQVWQDDKAPSNETINLIRTEKVFTNVAFQIKYDRGKMIVDRTFFQEEGNLRRQFALQKETNCYINPKTKEYYIDFDFINQNL